MPRPVTIVLIVIAIPLLVFTGYLFTRYLNLRNNFANFGDYWLYPGSASLAAVELIDTQTDSKEGRNLLGFWTLPENGKNTWQVKLSAGTEQNTELNLPVTYYRNGIIFQNGPYSTSTTQKMSLDQLFSNLTPNQTVIKIDLAHELISGKEYIREIRANPILVPTLPPGDAN